MTEFLVLGAQKARNKGVSVPGPIRARIHYLFIYLFIHSFIHSLIQSPPKLNEELIVNNVPTHHDRNVHKPILSSG
jgi:hypothetical protein